jgi:2-hydroxy-6-oxonona-2,4-dienedioate hydrolase
VSPPSSKPKLAFVHGFMGGSAQWQLQREALSETFDCVAVDLPGFGENTDAPAPNRIEGFAAYVLDALSGQRIDRFHLVGHSMGGMIV